MNDSTFDARPILTQIWQDAFFQHSEWMHFHELAMAEPFKAESEAQAFCASIAKTAYTALKQLGVTDEDLGFLDVSPG